MAPGIDPVLHLPACGYRRLRWRNGLGWTREIFAAPSTTSVRSEDPMAAWEWRASIADIEAATPYSRFPGIEREQVLLSGDGLSLDLGDGVQRDLLPPYGRQRFDGDATVHARPHGGRVEVLNLMWVSGQVLPRTWRRPLVGPMLLFVDPGDRWFVHVLAGRATVDGGRDAPLLERGDSAVLAAGPAARTRHLLEGGGEVLLVQLASVPVPPQ